MRWIGAGMRWIGAALGLILVAAPAAWGHGASGAVEGRGGVVIASSYDDGEGISFAKVTIRSPAGKTFHTGFTDQTGRFAFVPDQPGEWQFVAEDGMGHRVAVKIPVTPEIIRGERIPAGRKPGSISRIERTIQGICLIFGCLGLYFFWKGRKNAKMTQ